MKEFINPPIISSLASFCVESAMASSSDKVKVAALFTGGVSSSAEGQSAIDENASTVSLTPNICVVHEPSVAVEERKECVRDFLDHLSGEESAASHLVSGGEADDSDSFADIMSSYTAVGDAESEGWTFSDALGLASLSFETSA